MSEYGVVTEPRTIRMERLLPGPIERVWGYLTDTAERGKWFATGGPSRRWTHRVLLPSRRPIGGKDAPGKAQG